MKKGFTLVEVLVVVLIFVFLFAIILAILTQSDRAFSLGKNKLKEHQEARKVFSNIAYLLRQSSPDWIVNSTHYPLSISENSTRIDFYLPIFNQTSGEIQSLKKVTFKLNPENPKQLLKKIGLDTAQVVAEDIESLHFDYNNLKVSVNLTTQKEAGFNFNNYTVTLRNINATLNETEIIEPGEGEF
jgi:prepilin-type N-terminal cleavage/methylation domain-containing protein